VTEACRRKVDIHHLVTNDEQPVVGGVRIKIDGFSRVFHIRDA
jgi:hypothetical protein